MKTQTHSKKPWLSRFGLLALVAALGACNFTSSPSGPSLPQNAPTALVKGAVSSPVYDELKKVFRVVQYDGKQKMSDYNLLILDGDAHSPEDLRADALVSEAWRAGIGVLTVDAAEDDKRQGLGGRLGLATKDTSRGYFARSSRDRTGHASIVLVELPSKPSTVTVKGHPFLTGQSAAKTDDPTAFVKTMTGRLKGVPVTTQGRQFKAQDNPIPAGLILKTYYYSLADTVSLTGVNKNNDPVKTQTTSVQYDYTFNIYLDNQNNPQGNFQWVSVDVDITSNPSNGGAFACNACYTGADSNGNADEYAWFLAYQRVKVLPDTASNSLFSLVGSSPATTNGAKEVTTGLSFSIGFDGSSGVGSFQYSNEQTREIDDWKLTNEGAGNMFSWNYRSNDPLDADLNWWCHGPKDCNPIWGSSSSPSYPQKPNDISLSQLQLHAQGAWKTSSVVSQWVTISVSGTQGLADVWCPSDGGAFGCFFTNGSSFYDMVSSFETTHAQDLQINMASVVPIPIQSITFAPSPVLAGAVVTGTITLKSPAVEDTDIQISSNSQNATVLPTVTVKQGESTGTFQVLTNANGIAAGSSSTATFTAFYAGNYQAQLQIDNVRVAALAFDTNPVSALHPVNATVTMDGPVLADRDIALTSSSPNAVVPSKVTVKQGQASANFQVITNPVGIPPSGSTLATITAGTASAPLTVLFSSLSPQPMVSAGFIHACALKFNGTPVCWGANDGGESTPPSGLTFAAVGASTLASCGLKRDGSVMCWGSGSSGVNLPPSGLVDAVGLTVGPFNACAVRSNATVTCWGDNKAGQLNVPAGLSSVTQVAVGSEHMCALKGDGTVQCWGDNRNGQLNVPAGLAGVAQVSAGLGHTCALRSDGTALCWGDNGKGQLNIPAGLSGVVRISSDIDLTCAVRSDGTVACWGYSPSGRNTPPAGLVGVADVSVNGDPFAGYVAARMKDGTVVVWGANLPPPSGLNLLQP